MRFLLGLLSIGFFPGHFVEALRTLRAIPRTATPPRSRSREGERLTDWERRYLLRHDMRCPDCIYGHLLTILNDGCITRVHCSLCPTTLSLIWLDDYVNGHRLPSFPPEAEHDGHPADPAPH